MGYFRPASVREALGRLAAVPGSTLVAGCTDFYPAVGSKPVTSPIIDLSGVAEIRAISSGEHQIRFGALATWTDIGNAALPPALRGLQMAAREVGAIQIQNVGTIGGNLCNASPAADGVPPLLTVDAQVELTSLAGIRTLPLDQFILGNRRTMRRPDEILTAVVVPQRRAPAASTFLKLGTRTSLVISIASAAVLLQSDGSQRVAAAAVAIGACSPVPRRLPALEAELVGQPIGPALAERVAAAHLAPLSPIDDVRATAEYRLDAAITLIRRAIIAVAAEGDLA